jgi:hypothetical protein
VTHNELVRRAEKWLKSINCGVVFIDAIYDRLPITPPTEDKTHG